MCSAAKTTKSAKVIPSKTKNKLDNINIMSNSKNIFTTKLDRKTFKVKQVIIKDVVTCDIQFQLTVLPMVGRCFLDMCHPEDRHLVREHFLSAVKFGRSSSYVYRFIG